MCNIEENLNKLANLYEETITGSGFTLEITFSRRDGTGEGDWPDHAAALIELSNWEGENIKAFADSGTWTEPFVFAELIDELTTKILNTEPE